MGCGLDVPGPGWVGGVRRQCCSPLKLGPMFSSRRPNYPSLPHALITSWVPGGWAGLPHFWEVGRPIIFGLIVLEGSNIHSHEGQKMGRRNRGHISRDARALGLWWPPCSLSRGAWAEGRRVFGTRPVAVGSGVAGNRSAPRCIGLNVYFEPSTVGERGAGASGGPGSQSQFPLACCVFPSV